MGAIVNGLRGTELDTGIDPKLILPLSTYLEQVGGEGGGVLMLHTYLLSVAMIAPALIVYRRPASCTLPLSLT